MVKGRGGFVLWIVLLAVILSIAVIYYTSNNFTDIGSKEIPIQGDQESPVAAPQGPASVSGTVTNGNELVLNLDGGLYSVRINATASGAAVLKVNGVLTTTLGRGFSYPIDGKTKVRVDDVRLAGGFSEVDVTITRSP
jgi:hypothetical protein